MTKEKEVKCLKIERETYQSKEKVIIIGMIGMALVAALGAFSKGFQDWTYKDWFKTSEKQEKETRFGLVKVNLVTDVKSSAWFLNLKMRLKLS